MAASSKNKFSNSRFIYGLVAVIVFFCFAAGIYFLDPFVKSPSKSGQVDSVRNSRYGSGKSVSAQMQDEFIHSPEQAELSSSGSDYLKNIRSEFDWEFDPSIEILAEDENKTNVTKFPSVEIPDNLRLIVGLSEDKSYIPRMNAVHKLDRNLSEQKVKALISFLHKKMDEENLRPLEFNAIKNDIVNELLKQRGQPENLGAHLMAMYFDESLDNIWRDYCLQFLGVWYMRTASPEERQAVKETLFDALRYTRNSFAGTSLIALANLTVEKEINRKEVSKAAYEIATSETTGNVSRITAIQICAKLGNRKILPYARKVAVSSGPVPVRMSAIAAVGMLGNGTDIEMLKKLTGSYDVRLKTASRAALKKLGVK